MIESEVRKLVKDYMQKTGWFIFPVHQQGFRAYKGISDYIAIKNGIVIFLEVKKSGGKQSDGQKKFQDDIQGHYGEYFCVDGVDDLIYKLQERGIK